MKKFFSEIVWFFGALLASTVLAFLYLLFVRISFQAEEVPPILTIRKYLAGIVVMLVCIYAVRWIVLAIKGDLTR